MVKFKEKSKFRTEIHLGLLAIVFSLLLLNFFSNIVIYQARSDGRDDSQSTLRAATLGVTRMVREMSPQHPAQTDLERLREMYSLSSLTLLPSVPPENSRESRRAWFASITNSLPPGQLPDLARKLISSDLATVTRGEADEYFMVSSITAGSNQYMLITSMNNSTLAYLDSSGSTIIIVSLISLLILAAVYFALYRFILSPFRKLRDMASEAGRTAGEDEISVEEIIKDYQKIIDELTIDKDKLRRLNETITSRAQSLEQFNDYLLDSIESGIVTIDLKGTVLTISSQAARILSIEPVDCQGESFLPLFNASTTLSASIKTAVDDGQLPDYTEHKLSQFDGELATLGVTMSISRNREGSRLGYAVLMNDQTKLHRLQEELEAKERLTAMGEMAGGLAHQLRNSLCAISGYGNLIKRKLVNSSQTTRTADSLLEETNEAESLIRQFLDFAKPFQLQSEREDIRSFLNGIIESYRSRASYPQIEFTLESDSSLIVNFDSLLLKQAVTNLMDNAAEAYQDRPGTVVISAVELSEQVQVEIRDFGCGIEANDLSKVFTPFYSKRPAGTGLGLPLAGKIANLHGGRIEVDSAVGRGTTFTICLPKERLVEASAETVCT